MFEKIVNSKINIVADWIIRLVMVNILIIICSLPIITIYPALSAGYNLFSDYIHKKSPRLFADYFKCYRSHIGKKIIIQLLILVVLALGYSNVRYYTVMAETDPSTFLAIGYYVTLALLATVYAVVLYSLVVVSVSPTTKIPHLIKLSFFLAGKFYLITLLLVIVSLSPFLLLLNYTTMIAFIFAGISIPLSLHALLTRGAKAYLESLGDTRD